MNTRNTAERFVTQHLIDSQALSPGIIDMIEQLIISVIEQEREACAKVAEDRSYSISTTGVDLLLVGESEVYATAAMREAELIAKAIRERSKS